MQACCFTHCIVSLINYNCQCFYAVFEGLLPPPHNSAILRLVFHLAHWHGLAKLRLHSDLSLDLLDVETTSLGEELRHFTDKTCPAFETRELKREADSRKRKAATTDKPSKPDASKPTAGPSKPSASKPEPTSDERTLKVFSLDTYKAHSLGDYVEAIKQHGTTDSFSTETVSGLFYNSV